METTTKIDAETLEKIRLSVSPSGYRVLIADEPQSETSKGGVYIPEAVLDQQRGVCMFGTVVSLGDLSYSREDMDDFEDWSEPGSVVIFSKYSGVIIFAKGVPANILLICCLNRFCDIYLYVSIKLIAYNYSYINIK